jgi:hypothetical protein
MPSEFHTPHDHIEDKTPAELRESAYRRGFQQGLQYAINILADGGGVAELQVYMEQIAAWRERRGKYKGKRDRLEHPPVPKAVKD